MSAQDDIDRALRVERLLADPDLKAAFGNVRAAIVERIEQCPMRDTEGAEKLRIMLRLLRDVQANLEGAIADGKVSQLRLSEDQEIRKRRFQIFR